MLPNKYVFQSAYPRRQCFVLYKLHCWHKGKLLERVSVFIYNYRWRLRHQKASYFILKWKKILFPYLYGYRKLVTWIIFEIWYFIRTWSNRIIWTLCYKRSLVMINLNVTLHFHKKSGTTQYFRGHILKALYSN